MDPDYGKLSVKCLLESVAWTSESDYTINAGKRVCVVCGHKNTSPRRRRERLEVTKNLEKLGRSGLSYFVKIARQLTVIYSLETHQKFKLKIIYLSKPQENRTCGFTFPAETTPAFPIEKVDGGNFLFSIIVEYQENCWN